VRERSVQRGGAEAHGGDGAEQSAASQSSHEKDYGTSKFVSASDWILYRLGRVAAKAISRGSLAAAQLVPSGDPQPPGQALA